jgi:hypothetical protein
VSQGELWQLIADRIVQDLEDDLFGGPLRLIALIRADVDPSVAQVITRDPRYRRIVIDRKGEHVIIVGVPYARDIVENEPEGDDAVPDSGSALPLVTRASRPPPAPSGVSDPARRSSRPPPLPAPDPDLWDDGVQPVATEDGIIAREAEPIRVEEHELVED